MPCGRSWMRELGDRAEMQDQDSAATPMMGKENKTSGTHRCCHLLPPLPPIVRNFALSFIKSAGRVHDSSSTSSSSNISADNSYAGGLVPSVHSSVSRLFRTRVPSAKEELLIDVAWPSNHTGPTVSVRTDDDDDDDGDSSSRHRWRSQTLREKKGTQSLASDHSVIDVYWDLSSARYGSRPEPIEGFYIAVVVHQEVLLLLGDTKRHLIEPLEGTFPSMHTSFVSRRERVVGIELHTTKLRFPDGSDHGVIIRCKGGPGSELSVWIGGIRVVNVRKLEYNFRGNETLVVDGGPVHLTWDLHGWWFGGPRDGATFVFRSGYSEWKKLWMGREEKYVYSLVVQAYKNPMHIDGIMAT